MDRRMDTSAEGTTISKIGIIGAGQMGGGIAQVCAVAGYEVRLQDISAEGVQKGLKAIEARLARLVDKQKLSAEARDGALARITTGTSLEDFSDCGMAIEAASENERVKREIFEKLCPVLPKQAIICTNTSSISVTMLAAHTDRPDRFMGMHFMNPVPVMKLVEIILELTRAGNGGGEKAHRGQPREEGGAVPDFRPLS